MSARVRRSAVITTALLLGALTACSGSETEADRPAEEPSSSAPSAPAPSEPAAPSADASEPAATDPGARRAVRAAARALLDADTGSYEVTGDLGEMGRIDDRGTFVVSDEAWESARMTVTGAGELLLRGRSVAGTTWLRLGEPGDPVEWPCWVESAGVLREIGADAASSAYPAALLVATELVGQEDLGDGRYRGTADLVTVIQLANSRALHQGTLDPASDVQVPVELTVEDGTLTGFSAGAADVMTALGRAMSSPEDALTDAAQLTGSLDVRFSQLGESLAVAPPRPAERVQVESAGEIDAALQACGAP